MKQLDYISVLAGGRCYTNCGFCVGNHIRKNEPPHFSDVALEFIDQYSGYAKELSISGSTSDPMYCDYKTLNNILDAGINCSYKLSLHTSVYNNRTKAILGSVHELCLSVHSINKVLSNKLYDDVVSSKLRISSVCTSNNKSWYETGEFFDTYGADKFTIRLNIHEPELYLELPYDKINSIHNQTTYRYNNKTIAIWNFRDANKNIKALYLWPNGEIKRQCFWDIVLDKLG